MDDGAGAAAEPLTAEERALLTALLRPAFPGEEALREQLAGLAVTERERTGCALMVWFAVDAAIRDRYRDGHRVALTAVAHDDTGQPLDILLWTDAGMLDELEIIGLLSQSVGAIDMNTLRDF